MSEFAVISDIHANLAALVAVLADIRRNKIKRIICLGDIVGYGPDPRECLTLVRRNCDVVLKGNHDLAVLLEPLGFNPRAHEAVLWTRRRIRARWFSSVEVRKNWSMIKKAYERYEEDDMLFVHGSPRDPINEYVDDYDIHDSGFGPGNKIVEIMNSFKHLCFAGHTHQPAVITEDYKYFQPEDFGFEWKIGEQKLFVNCGSVGQPRDEDPRAKYLIYRDDTLIFRRVDYDIDETAQKIFEIPELHDSLAIRLHEGI